MEIATVKYNYESSIHNVSAPGEIVPVLIKLFLPKSVVDIGCGLGTFLHVFEEYGIADVRGLDGDWVSPDKLFISKEKFTPVDLEKPLHAKRQFDLVLCLEVAEHLEESNADNLVKALTNFGKIIVFSAAVNEQGGQNHKNEQPHSYWQQKFLQHDYYYYDVLRPIFWNNEKVDAWYKQNMFVVAHRSVVFENNISSTKAGYPIPTYIHPGMFAIHTNHKNLLIDYSDRLKKDLDTAIERQNIFYVTSKSIRENLRKLSRLIKKLK